MSDYENPLALAPNQSTLVIAGEDIPFGAYQAIYHKLTKRVEKRTKTYKDAYDVSYEDIHNLHQRLSQLLKQYSVRSNRCQITYDIKDDTSREHSSFEKFNMSDCSIRSCTKSLNYEFDFLIVLQAEVPEASEIAQRYTVSINIDQDFYENNDFDAPYFMRGMIYGKNINLSIEFSDYAVSQAIQAAVDGWIETLPKRESGKFLKFANILEKPVRNYSTSVIRILCFSMGVVAIYNSHSIKDGFILILSAMTLASLMTTISDGFVDNFYKNISNIRPMTYLTITQGDRDRKISLLRKVESAKAVSSFLLFGLVITITVSVFSNFIYDMIKYYLK